MGDIILRYKLGDEIFFCLALVFVLCGFSPTGVEEMCCACDTRTIDSESESGETDILYKQASKTGE